MAHLGGEQEYGAWCAADAILSPSLPLGGWPADLPLTNLGGRHARRHERHHEPLFRWIAPLTVRRFQRLATVAPVQLWLSDKADARAKQAAALAVPYLPSAHLRGVDNPRGGVVSALWHMFRDPEADRLKRCSRCRTWFVDVTKKMAQVYCSRACRNRAWSRAARRAARHSQYRRRKKR